ncbi:futalosine hydrolase [Halalkalibacterium ligniniphilum]|uniref:futalosine hydrolase n=1 Tax=Halalkalibacterium ligniniphilum TaxID=1134413 RepID=UPI000349B630|nr:futalosine hydrolase [Halalkalibacterium ligniniphilum]
MVESRIKKRTNDGRILVVASITAEKEAVLRGLKENSRFDVVVSGVGVAAAAARTATALATNTYSFVLCIGIGGGFPNRADTGSLVVANKIVAADLGAETRDGFSSIDELGFGTAQLTVDTYLATKVTDALHKAALPVTTGPILTVSTVTGTAETATELATRIPGAAVEAMEGYGAATAAHMQGIPFLEIRAISNQVGPRDRDSWRIKEALYMLELACSHLPEVL